jgi:rieske iron-sulfur protein
METEGANDVGAPGCYRRRTLLKAALGLGLGWSWCRGTMAQEGDPRHARPQEGDRFVFASGERKGALITPADLPVGGPPVLTYPLDPQSSTVRDGSRLNQVLLIRFEPEALAEETRVRAAEGVVAYSAICTHTGCDVADWKDQTKTLLCFCHFSEFDPKDGAKVLDGPAPRRLAALPLKVADGFVIAAGGFTGRVGFQPG